MYINGEQTESGTWAGDNPQDPIRPGNLYSLKPKLHEKFHNHGKAPAFNKEEAITNGAFPGIVKTLWTFVSSSGTV